MPTCWRTLVSNVRAFSMVVLAALPAACGPYSPIGPTVSLSRVPSPTPRATPIADAPTPASTVASVPAIDGTMAVAASATPAPAILETGAKVDVGGYQLYVRCTGQGTPPAVFDAGASGWSSVWYDVEPKVAAFTKACVYDRANRGQSDRGPIPNTSKQMVRDLHTLLANVHMGGPFVLVGQSFGGMNMGLYARLYPTESAGLVMVDAVHEAAYVDQAITPCPTVCHGVDFTESGRQVQAAPPMPDIPLVVLQHGVPGLVSPDMESHWAAWQQDLASRSSHGKLIIAERSSHNIQYGQPELVVAAIQEIVKQERLREAADPQDRFTPVPSAASYICCEAASS